MRVSSTISALMLAFGAAFISAGPTYSQEGPRHAIRLDLKSKAISLLKDSKNECRAFADIAAYAVGKSDNVGDLLEDLKLVLIGADMLRRKDKRGPYHIDMKTGDSGFKSELKDNSPQIEHAMAAIYLAKIIPPGGVGGKGSFVEFIQGAAKLETPSAADMLLYMYGEDLGDRLMKSNMDRFPEAIRRTLCE